MIDKLTYFETDTDKYPMAFTLNVMEAIQDEYGSLDDWSKLMQSRNIKALKFFMKEAIDEGVDIERKDREPLTLKQVGRILTASGLQSAAEQIQKLITKSVPKPADKSKNAKTTQKK